ncbi:MAG: hypothetical protein K2X48_13560 [Chitinophagaceae bacterium]|nr:hypothetical protein [Chitinophagaceae bacterium]
MEMEIKREASKQIILDDNNRFSYTIKQVEIANSLGAVVAILDEYFISNSAGENYKLYKTKEGNWYDVPETNKGADKGVLLGLKLGIDNL